MRLAVPLEPRQSAPHGAADVEAATGGGHVALAPPPDVALHLVTGVETLALDQARREAERHGGVVGPLAGLQVERTAADHVVDRLEGAGRLELESGAERVTGRQAEQAATEAVLRADLIQRALLPRGLCPLTDVRVLLGRFRGARLAVRLLHALPPLRDPAQGPHLPSPRAARASNRRRCRFARPRPSSGGRRSARRRARRRWRRGCRPSPGGCRARPGRRSGCRSCSMCRERRRASSAAIAAYGSSLSAGPVRSMKWSMPARSRVRSLAAASSGSFAPGYSPAAMRPGITQ